MHQRAIQIPHANALVEFVLTAPLFFLLVWGLLDVARLETLQILFRHHGHDLARHLAATELTDSRQLEEEGCRWSANHGWALSDVRVSIFPIPFVQKAMPHRLPKVIDRIQIDLRAPFSPISPLMLALQKLHPFQQYAQIEEVRVYAVSSVW